MKLFLVTHKTTQETKIVKTDNEFNARWLAGRSKKCVDAWTCEEFEDPYIKIDAKDYWKMFLKADQRPFWVKEKYGLN